MLFLAGPLAEKIYEIRQSYNIRDDGKILEKVEKVEDVEMCYRAILSGKKIILLGNNP
jgi:hypothetical protein